MTAHQARLFKIIILMLITTLYLNYNLIVQPKAFVKVFLKPDFKLQRTNEMYDQLIDLKDFKFTINPPLCSGYDGNLLLVIIVSSDPQNFHKRSTIRSTWGYGSTKVAFLIGKSDVDTQIKNESLMYGDIVQGSFKDSYRNMSYKHVMGLKWASHHCPNARYVLKTDDDVFVNMFVLEKFLANTLSLRGATGLIICEMFYESEVLRNESKWSVTVEEFPGNSYPPYCTGAAIIYSQDVVQRLQLIAQEARYFWIDDVFVTGILVEKARLKHTSYDNMFMESVEEGVSIIHEGADSFRHFMFGPLDLTSEEMVLMWKALGNSSGIEEYETERALASSLV